MGSDLRAKRVRRLNAQCSPSWYHTREHTHAHHAGSVGEKYGKLSGGDGARDDNHQHADQDATKGDPDCNLPDGARKNRGDNDPRIGTQCEPNTDFTGAFGYREGNRFFCVSTVRAHCRLQPG